MKKMKTGVIGLGALVCFALFGKLSCDLGGGGGGWLGLLGSGKFGSSGSETKPARPASPGADAVLKTSGGSDGKSEPSPAQAPLGVVITMETVQVHVYVRGDDLQFEGKKVKVDEVVTTVKKLADAHKGKTMQVIAQTDSTTRMKGLHELKNAIKGTAEFIGPTETGP